MLAKPKKIAAVSASIFLGSLVICFIAERMIRGETHGTAADLVMAIAGIVAFISCLVACRFYAVAKGYSGELGLRMALLNFLGVLILLCLKDKYPNR